MANAKRRHDWNIASNMMALTAEINRDRKRRRKPYKAEDFDPYMAKRKVPVRVTAKEAAALLGAKFTPRTE